MLLQFGQGAVTGLALRPQQPQLAGLMQAANVETMLLALGVRLEALLPVALVWLGEVLLGPTHVLEQVMWMKT